MELDYVWLGIFFLLAVWLFAMIAIIYALVE